METKLTKEMLSTYYPYDLKFQVEDVYGEKTVDTMNGLFEDCITLKNSVDWYLDGYDEHCMFEAKPILHPLSSLTKTIIHEGKEVNVLFELMKVQFYGIKRERCCIFLEGFIYYGETRLGKLELDQLSYNSTMVLVKYHFNVFNLPDHLFIDKATV